MNDPRDRQAELLADVFHDDWSNGSAAAFAQRAAAHARARRRRRRALINVGAGAAVILVAAMFATLRQRSTPPPAGGNPPPSAGVAVKPAARGYEIISDTELLAHLRDRSILVVQKENGAREFVFLPNE